MVVTDDWQQPKPLFNHGVKVGHALDGRIVIGGEGEPTRVYDSIKAKRSSKFDFSRIELVVNQWQRELAPIDDPASTDGAVLLTDWQVCLFAYSHPHLFYSNELFKIVTNIRKISELFTVMQTKLWHDTTTQY